MILRRATLEDADRLLAWRNDRETRRYSSRTEVDRETHGAWIRRMLHDSDGLHRLFIAEEEAIPIGTIRLDVATGEVHLIVAPEVRGRGCAALMLRLVVEQATQAGLARLWGRIHLGNLPSRRAFFKAGFEETAVIAERIL